MNITIEALGKWSVSLRDWEKKDTKNNVTVLPRAKTARQMDDLKAQGQPILASDAYEKCMAQMEQHRPNYRYRPISQNTVLGILAHAIGEVRPLATILQEIDHPITKIQNHLHFTFNRSSFQHELVRLHSPPKKATQPGGFIHATHAAFPLASDTAFSRCVFSVLDVSTVGEALGILNQIQSSNSVVINRLLEQSSSKRVDPTRIQRDMQRWSDITKAVSASTSPDYQTYQQFCSAVGTSTKNIGASLFLATLKMIGENHPKWHEELLKINPKFFELTNNSVIVSGFHTSTHEFNFRDYASTKLGIKSEGREHSFIYQLKLDKTMFNPSVPVNQKVNLGVTRESGTLYIHLDINSEDAQNWLQWIQNSGVNVFQVGKKGLGYISSIWDSSF